VVDNSSTEESLESLRAHLGTVHPAVGFVAVDWNSGFAGGANRGIFELMQQCDWDHLLLLNSDARICPVFNDLWVRTCASVWPDLAGGRIDIDGANVVSGAAIESIGMSLHRSLIASERTSSEDDPLLGPTGAFLVLSRAMIERLSELHGEVFSDAFFCYAEDTDLCVRARLLGIQPVMLGPETVAIHAGQASSGGKASEFVFFYGIRNTFWMQLRCIPIYTFVRCIPWMAFAHVGIVLKAVTSGRIRLLVRVYIQTVRRIPKLLAERRRIQSSRTLSQPDFHTLVSRRFYRKGYVLDALRSIISFDSRR
jgi:GT2 family glycosyltransferase